MSGEWFGEIPQHWESQRIKTLFNLRDERSYLALDEVNLISLYANVGVRQHSDIEHTTGNKARNADGYKIVRQNDIIVNILLCWMGAIGRSDYDGVTSPAYDVYAPKKDVNSRYYHYLFRIPLFSQQCYKVGKGIMAMRWRTYSPQFRNVIVPIPPRDEQEQIVCFLDWKVSAINRLIAVKRKQIQKLEDALSSRLKNELGSIPNAKNIPLKRIFAVPMADGPHETPVFCDMGVPFISAEASHDGKIHLEECRGYITREQHEIYCQKVRPQKNDIYIVKSGSTTGKTVMVDFDEEFSIWSPLALVRCNELAIPRYVFYFCTSELFQQQVRDNWSYGTQPNIGMGVLQNLRIMLPPLEQQQRIADAFDNYWNTTQALKENINQQIVNLHDLKARLISDVVTGKIDVRGVEVPEFVPVEEETGEEETVLAEEEANEQA